MRRTRPSVPSRPHRRLGSSERTGPRCVLDSGGLSTLFGPSQRARAWLRWMVEHGARVVVPMPILVETVTGESGRDAETNRILGVLARAGGILVSPDETTARLAGALRYRARLDDGVDALVAAEAIGDGSLCKLLTSDPKDLARLLVAAPNVSVQVV